MRFISYKRLFKAAANICVCFMLFMPLTAKQLPASEIIITSKIEDILVSKTSTIPKNPEPNPSVSFAEGGCKLEEEETPETCQEEQKGEYKDGQVVELDDQSQPSFSIQKSLSEGSEKFTLLIRDNWQEYLVEPDYFHEVWDKYKYIEKTIDLDGDGFEEALLVTVCLGSGCGGSTHIVSRVGDGIFDVTTHPDLVGGPDKWPSYSIKSTSDMPEIWVYNTIQAGEDNYAEEVITVLGFIDGTLKELSKHSSKPPSKVIMQVTADEVSDFESKILEIDLDFDGEVDELKCKYWDKFGTLDCEIFSTNLGKISINSDLNGYFAGGCDRIGILESKSNGMRDLVCDQNKILRFNQHEYTR